MKTLYLRIVYITLIVMVLSSLLGFLGANLYYQVKLKPVNDEKIMKVAKEIKQYYLTNDEVKIENYLEHIGELGYEVLKVNQAGDKKYFGEAFRKTAIDQKVIDDVLAGEPYHGILNFNTGWFITGFLITMLGTLWVSRWKVMRCLFVQAKRINLENCVFSLR